MDEVTYQQQQEVRSAVRARAARVTIERNMTAFIGD
jgi:hypothetical protein